MMMKNCMGEWRILAQQHLQTLQHIHGLTSSAWDDFAELDAETELFHMKSFSLRGHKRETWSP